MDFDMKNVTSLSGVIRDHADLIRLATHTVDVRKDVLNSTTKPSSKITVDGRECICRPGSFTDNITSQGDTAYAVLGEELIEHDRNGVREDIHADGVNRKKNSLGGPNVVRKTIKRQINLLDVSCRLLSCYTGLGSS